MYLFDALTNIHVHEYAQDISDNYMFYALQLQQTRDECTNCRITDTHVESFMSLAQMVPRTGEVPMAVAIVCAVCGSWLQSMMTVTCAHKCTKHMYTDKIKDSRTL
jgi:hypothetical protein